MGGCATRYQELDLTADSFTVTMKPSEVKFFGITLTQAWIDRKLDMVIRIHVEKGRLGGVYCARDRAFPNQRRHMWQTNRYCKCPNPTCDHCYPYCLNEMGGICIECMVHDEKFDRIAHELHLGGLPSDVAAKAAGAGISATAADGSIDPNIELNSDAAESDAAANIPEPPYLHQTDYEFSLRLSPTSLAEKPFLAPGHYFLSVEAAEENVSKALRKQRALEGEDEVHTTVFSIWIEEKQPRAIPQAGNEERVAQAAAHLAERLKNAEKKREFGRKFDGVVKQQKDAEAVQKALKELGVEEEEKKNNNTRVSDGLDVDAEEEEEKKG